MHVCCFASSYPKSHGPRKVLVTLPWPPTRSRTHHAITGVSKLKSSPDSNVAPTCCKYPSEHLLINRQQQIKSTGRIRTRALALCWGYSTSTRASAESLHVLIEPWVYYPLLSLHEPRLVLRTQHFDIYISNKFFHGYKQCQDDTDKTRCLATCCPLWWFRTLDAESINSDTNTKLITTT